MHQASQASQALEDDSHTVPQSERFEKRLNVYRSHQNECRSRVDQNIFEISEQQNHEIAKLQMKKTKDCGKHQKRVNKRGIRKQLEVDKNKQMLMTGADKFQKPLNNPPPSYASTLKQSLQQFSTSNNNFQHQLLNIKQEFPEVLISCNQLDDDLEDIDFKGIENLVKQVGQPLTPEVLNFEEEVQQYPTPYQFLQHLPPSSGMQNYPPLYFYNPNWMS